MHDGAGRLVLILQAPERHTQPTDVTFGGRDFQHLYVTAGDNVFRRRMNTRGLPPVSAAQ